MTVADVRQWARGSGIWLPAPAGTQSREVSFSIALEWAAPHLAVHTDLPRFATPAWRDELDERRKIAAAVVAGIDWAMRVEAEAEAQIAASHAISQVVRETARTPQSSREFLREDAAEAPFIYPPRRAA